MLVFHYFTLLIQRPWYDGVLKTSLYIGKFQCHDYLQKQHEGKRHRGRPRKYPEHFYNIVNGKMKYPGAKERVSSRDKFLLTLKCLNVGPPRSSIIKNQSVLSAIFQRSVSVIVVPWERTNLC